MWYSRQTLPFLIWRIFDEEAFLAKNLMGYSEYRREVRYRLAPENYVPWCYEICELLMPAMRLLHVLFGLFAHGLRDFHWVLGHHFLPEHRSNESRALKASSSKHVHDNNQTY
jgi:hypothetical protein